MWPGPFSDLEAIRSGYHPELNASYAPAQLFTTKDTKDLFDSTVYDVATFTNHNNLFAPTNPSVVLLQMFLRRDVVSLAGARIVGVLRGEELRRSSMTHGAAHLRPIRDEAAGIP
jgi:hypothetical protein